MQGAWWERQGADHIILVARVGNNSAFTSEAEMRHMQQDCALDLGRVKVKMSGYLRPASSDSHLYLVFPRGLGLADTILGCEIYWPGVSGHRSGKPRGCLAVPGCGTSGMITYKYGIS